MAGADEHLASRRAAAAQAFVADVDHPVLEPDDAHHLSRVLRLRPGEAVVAADGRGAYRLCSFELAPLRLVPASERAYEPPTEPPVAVALPPLKGERLAWAVQKLTEVGVDEVALVLAERAVVRWDGPRAEASLERLRAVARSAAAQSRRARLPVIRGLEHLEELGASGRLCLAEPGGGPPSLKWPVVAVGPEGGWAAGEVARGWPTISLGPTVLRSETAAVAAGVLLAALRAGTVAQAEGVGGCPPGRARGGPSTP